MVVCGTQRDKERCLTRAENEEKGKEKGNYLRWYDTVLIADNDSEIMYFTKALPIALCNLTFSFFSSFFHDLFRYNCQIAFTFIRYREWWFDIRMHCEMITTLKLVNTFITSHSYHCSVCVVRTLKIYFCS